MKSKCGHFGVQQGKKVMLHFKDGSKLVTKFKEKKGATVIMMDGQKVKTKLLRTISIYKK